MTNVLGAGDYGRVRVLFADQLNLARGKYLPASIAASGESRLCIGVYCLTYGRQMVPAPGAKVLEGLPDIELKFDADDLRPGWEPNTRIALCDLEFEGAPSGLSGRAALKKAVADWQALGYEPMIGLEGEAYVFERGGDGGWMPYETPGSFVYGTGPMMDPAGLIEDIWKTAHECGLPIESINTEFDSPQFELTMRFADALKACDDFFLFRTMAREILYRRGYLLSFMPAPISGRGGSGLHVNLSFRDGNGNNAFAGGTGRGALSPLVSGCIAGLIHHHEALAGLLAPTVNSYARLKPANLCGYWANWGHDHRATAVRVSGESGAAARIEHRVADCAVSPYVAAAAVLQAARLGFTGELTLPPEETNDGLENVNTDRHAADSLNESLDHLERDEALIDAVGPLLIQNYIAIKRAEAKELEGKSEAEVLAYYLPYL